MKSEERKVRKMKHNGKISRGLLLATLFTIHCSLFTSSAQAQSVVDEVVWVVGDEAILKSDIE